MLFGNGRNSAKPQCFPHQSDVIRLWDSGTAIVQLNPSKGVFNWAPLDARISEAQAANIPLILTLGRTPPWAALPKTLPDPGAYGDPTSNAPMDLDALATFMDALLAHTGKAISYIEPWNEWNAAGYWAGTLEQLVEQQDLIYSKAHAAGMLVTTPTPCWNPTSHWPSIDVATDAFFATGAPFDIVTFHGYLPNGAPSTQIQPTLWAMQQVMKKYGKTNPLWDTEFGPNAPTNIAAGQQRLWVFDALLTRMSMGISLACWYQWDNQTHGTCADYSGNLTTYGQAWTDFYNAIKIGMG